MAMPFNLALNAIKIVSTNINHALLRYFVAISPHALILNRISLINMVATANVVITII